MIEDVKTLLSGVSNIYRGSMPDSPDNAVCIYPTGGFARDLSGTEVEEPTFMIKVRNTSYDTGEGVCETIKDTLHGVNNNSSTNGDFLLIAQQGDVNYIGRDDSNRFAWTMNFRAYYRRG